MHVSEPRHIRALSLSDAPTADAQQFNFERITRTLLDFIGCSSPDAPFNICLSGGWGTGKTSLLRTLEKELRGAPRGTSGIHHDTIWFEPWKLADEGEVRNALARCVLERVSQDAGFLKGARIDVDPRSVLRVLADRFLNVDMDQLSRVYQAQAATRDTFTEVDSLFRRVADVYLNKKPRRRLVVFVDDLDRCRPARVVEVLESVKLFFDLPGMVFVFALDRDQVANAVVSQYRFSDDDARVYLEKIFQLTVPLPRKRSDDLVRFLEEKLGEVGVEVRDDRLAEAIVSRFGRNLRNLKLFINGFSFQRSLIADPQTRLDPHQLFKWLYLEHTMPNSLTAAVEGGSLDLVVALEFLAHGGFLHDRVRHVSYVKRLRRASTNLCSLVVLAIVGDTSESHLLPRLNASERALVEALMRDGEIASTLKVLREGRAHLADADLWHLVFLTRSELTDGERRHAPGSSKTERDELTLVGGPLTARDWNRIGDEMRSKGDLVGSYLSYLMAHLMEPRSAFFLMDVSWLMRTTDRRAAAMALMRDAFRLDPTETYVHTEAASLYDVELKREDLGSLLYRMALSTAKTSSDGHTLLPPQAPYYLSWNLAGEGRHRDAFLACLDAHLGDREDVRMRERLFEYARKADIELALDVSDSELERQLTEARTAGEYPLHLSRAEQQTIVALYESHPGRDDEQVAAELSRPPF